MGNKLQTCENCFSEQAVDPRKTSLNRANANDKVKKQEPKPHEDVQVLKSNPPPVIPLHEHKNEEKKQQNVTVLSDDDRSEHSAKPSKKVRVEKKPCFDDFTLMKVLGRGSFGKVYLVQKKDSHKFYALKSLKKEDIFKRNQVDNALSEKNIMQNTYHPFIVRLRYSFQDETTLYLVIDYCPGGELFNQLRQKGKFDEDTTRFYAAEVILGLAYLHDKLDVIYRDLKPENILLDKEGHAKITDFGLSKVTKKTFSFCGTPEYLAPEILLQKGHDKAVDWWSLGCMIYEMLAGYPPFSNQNKRELYNDILKSEPMYPQHFSNNAKDLIKKLLVRDPKSRLGSSDAQEIQRHPFFEHIDWNDLLARKVPPPIKPIITKPEDVRNFDKTFTKEKVEETPVQNLEKVKNDPRNDFQNFTYAQNDGGMQTYLENHNGVHRKN